MIIIIRYGSNIFLNILTQLSLNLIQGLTVQWMNYAIHSRDGNLILTALTIGRVPLINATKSLGFVLAQVVLTLAWASARVRINNPAIGLLLSSTESR